MEKFSLAFETAFKQAQKAGCSVKQDHGGGRSTSSRGQRGQGPISLSRVAFARKHCHWQHLLRQLKVAFEAEGTMLMWFYSRKKVVNGLSGKEGVYFPRGPFRNMPVAPWEGFAMTTSFSIRVQKSIAVLRDRVLSVTAETKAYSREASQNIQQNTAHQSQHQEIELDAKQGFSM